MSLANLKKSWLRLPTWGALMLGFGGLVAGGARATARREEERSAFFDYRSALDREERAAKHFARLMRRAGHLRKTGVVLQLARIQTERWLPLDIWQARR